MLWSAFANEASCHIKLELCTAVDKFSRLKPAMGTRKYRGRFVLAIKTELVADWLGYFKKRTCSLDSEWIKPKSIYFLSRAA